MTQQFQKEQIQTENYYGKEASARNCSNKLILKISMRILVIFWIIWFECSWSKSLLCGQIKSFYLVFFYFKIPICDHRILVFSFPFALIHFYRFWFYFIFVYSVTFNATFYGSILSVPLVLLDKIPLIKTYSWLLLIINAHIIYIFDVDCWNEVVL